MSDKVDLAIKYALNPNAAVRDVLKGEVNEFNVHLINMIHLTDKISTKIPDASSPLDDFHYDIAPVLENLDEEDEN